MLNNSRATRPTHFTFYALNNRIEHVYLSLNLLSGRLIFFICTITVDPVSKCVLIYWFTETAITSRNFIDTLHVKENINEGRWKIVGANPNTAAAWLFCTKMSMINEHVKKKVNAANRMSSICPFQNITTIFTFHSFEFFNDWVAKCIFFIKAEFSPCMKKGALLLFHYLVP